jgi:PAS domain S-box-containing protein
MEPGSAESADTVPAPTRLPAASELAPISPRLFEVLVRHSQDAIALVSAEATILYASPATTRLLGYLPDKVIAAPSVFVSVHPDDQARALAAFAALLAQPEAVAAGAVRCRHRDGTWRWLEVTGTNLLSDPEVGAIVVNFRDVTDRMQQEAARAVQARLEGALLVARTASHELLNALQPISGYADLLSAEPAIRADPRLTLFTGEIVAAALDAAERVRRLQQIVRLEEDTTVLGPEYPVLDLERSTAPE